jgi:23S rRNA (pseudouridine1915-N3)-methyltransferase
MKLCVLLPGKIKPNVLAPAQKAYADRLRAFGGEVVEYKDEKIASRTPEQAKQVEAERIFKHLKERDYLVACDERGRAVKTMEIADLIRNLRQGRMSSPGKSRLVVVIGGALGLAESVRQKADAVWSLSSLVLAGGVARVVILEGLYRAFTLVEGHPYHNG